MARKIDTIRESLEYLRGFDWSYSNTMEVHDQMLKTISDAVRSAACEALTRASIPHLGGSWSVALIDNRDPEVFRELCSKAIVIAESKTWVKAKVQP